MSFNPLETLRKKSKAIMAVVTIFIMVIFILGSGLRGGDFFNDVLPRWFGGKGKDPILATCYGHSFRSSQLRKILASRAEASQFMMFARDTSNFRIMKQLSNQMGSSDLLPETVTMIRPIVDSYLILNDPQNKASEKEKQTASSSYFIQLLINYNRETGQIGAQFLNYLAKLERESKKTKDIDSIRKIMSVMEFDAQRLLERRKDMSYFQLVPNTSYRDAALFALFLSKAEKLGINYSDDFVNRLIEMECHNNFTKEDAGRILLGLNRSRRDQIPVDEDELIEALKNEFRVRAVVVALRGILGTKEFPQPVSVTPLELFDYYKDQCSENTWNLLELPVESFLAQVKEQPTQDELKKLYLKYKGVETNPEQENPGFRDGFRIKLGYVATPMEKPYYKKNLSILEGVQLLGTGLIPGNIPGGDLVGIMQIASAKMATDWEIAFRYREMIDKEKLSKLSSWEDSVFAPKHESTKLNPVVIAATAGIAVPQLAPIPNLYGLDVPYLIQQEISRKIDIRQRAQIGMQTVLGYFSPAPYLSLPALVPTVANVPAFPPIERYRSFLIQQLREKEETNLFQKDFDSFKEKLKELSKNSIDPKSDNKLGAKANENSKKVIAAEIEKKVNKYVEEFAKSRGFTFGSTTQAHDKFELPKDPALKTMVEQYPPSKDSGQSFSANMNSTSWENVFFASLPSSKPNDVLYSGFWFANNRSSFPPTVGEKEKQYFVWSSEIVPPHSFITYEDAPDRVKQKVIAAWKFQKARELAKKKAEELKDKIKPIADDQLIKQQNLFAFTNRCRDLAIGFSISELDHVAPLLYTPQLRPDPGSEMQSTYQPYQLPKEKIAYPGAIAKNLLDKRNSSLGESLVLADQPVSKYYVATLVKRQEKSLENFSTDVFAKSAITLSNPLYKMRYREVGVEFQNVLVDRLKFEGKYKETEELMKLVDKKSDE